MRSWPLRVVIPLLLASAGCACPPLVESYASPEATLATWQAMLCRNDVDGEYRCLSAGFKQRMGNFQTYWSQRNAWVSEEPLVARLLARSDLQDAIASRSHDEAAGEATLELGVGDRRTRLAFVRETTILIERSDGPPVVSSSRVPLARLLQRRGGRAWIDLDAVGLALSGAPPDGLLAVRIEQRWKLDGVDGLLDPLEGAAP